MLVIRLQRTGRKNLATYRLVVAEKARPVKGKFQDILGHYLPMQKDSKFSFNAEKIEHLVSNGAVPSDTVARMLKRNGMKNMDKFIKKYSKQRSKSAPAEEPAPVAAPAAPVAEAPVAEVPAEAPVVETPAVETPAAETPAPETPAA